jgi:hypothetical protein
MASISCPVFWLSGKALCGLWPSIPNHSRKEGGFGMRNIPSALRSHGCAFSREKKEPHFLQSNVWMFTYLSLPACSVAAVTLGPYTTDEAGAYHISTCQTILNQTSYVFCYPIFEEGHFVKESRWCLEHFTSATTYHRIDVEDAHN